MTPKQAAYVRQCIEIEGFDYAFVNYSDFNTIQDSEFHTLRENYLSARQYLADFMGVDA